MSISRKRAIALRSLLPTACLEMPNLAAISVVVEGLQPTPKCDIRISRWQLGSESRQDRIARTRSRSSTTSSGDGSCRCQRAVNGKPAETAQSKLTSRMVAQSNNSLLAGCPSNSRLSRRIEFLRCHVALTYTHRLGSSILAGRCRSRA